MNNNTSLKKFIAPLLVICAAAISVHCFINRYTQVRQAYTFTHRCYTNDVLTLEKTDVINEFGDVNLSINKHFYSNGTASTDQRHFFYKYDRHGNKTLCVEKDDYGDILEKNVFRYNKYGNCIYHKREDIEGYFGISNTEYNDKNLKIKEEIELHEAKGDCNYVHEYFYDDSGRIIKETSSSQLAEDMFYEYDGNGLLKTLRKEHNSQGYTDTEKYEYNEKGQPVHIAEYFSDELYSEKDFVYDQRGNLILLTETTHNANGENVVKETASTYDENGCKTSEVVTYADNESMSSKKTVYEYDDDSNLIMQADYDYTSDNE